MTKAMSLTGAWIRDTREWLDAPAKSLALEAGISPQHLSDIERGRRLPSYRVAKRISKALQTDFTIIQGKIRDDLLAAWMTRP